MSHVVSLDSIVYTYKQTVKSAIKKLWVKGTEALMISCNRVTAYNYKECWMHVYTILASTCHVHAYGGSTQGSRQNFLQLVVHLCIINNLGGLANNGCGQLHVHCFACCNAEKKNKTKVSQKPADFIW